MLGSARARSGVTIALLCGYWVLGLGGNFCFKEGGTDPAHWLHYFVGGNLLGIGSTALLMGVYARLNANLTLVLATAGAFFLQQVSFWGVYHTSLTLAQASGIGLVGVGTIMASLPAGPAQTEVPAP